MLDIDFSRALHRSGFQHRIYESGDGALVFRLADRSGHVRLSRGEWTDVGTFFEEESRPIVRRAKWALALYLPCWVLLIAICNIAPVRRFINLIPWHLPTMALLGTLFLTPVAIYLWQSHRIGLIAAAIEAELGRRERVGAPPAVLGRVPRAIDIALLALVGPHLLISLLGELRPGIFRNTPFTNAHLTPLAMAGFGLICLRLLWPRIAQWRAQR